jgi:hypothetical protein
MGLIDSGLICTERTSSLEEERDALERRTRPRLRSHIAGIRREPPRGELGGSRASAIVRGGGADRRR